MSVLAAKMDREARALAESVSTGIHSTAPENAKFDLRALSLMLAGWAEEVRDLEAPRGQVITWPVRPGIMAREGWT